ncbi:hypothetical protein HZF08_07740 [Paenibacillus sp. CGMCC 1.16610]|uniref:Uncharacterized protein n=1 Tax=Paenibacillus anseongense TaxID=2682845 RepID=A0ABW9UDI0_9BACL|nr:MULTISPECIES: hypothetical protein [Paenibacillus]MBA2938195.1 hypothetical protein [Paenibacillus sp. CGMCC 1.16610]MVQ37253.1 hypothetical protein [Paenibacillus anseongense]
MEYILYNTDIFDPTLAEKFDAVILSELHQFADKKVYKFIASFHVENLSNVSGFESFKLPPSNKVKTRNKSDGKDKMYEVLGFQLKQLEGVLLKNNIEFISTTIQGDRLESSQIIKIEIESDMPKSTASNNGRKQQFGRVSTVMPSKIYTENLVSKLASERLTELYNKFFSIIRNKKMMSEILEIDETDDDNKLFQAFVKKYGRLWLTTCENEKELLDNLKNKSIEIVNKYLAD